MNDIEIFSKEQQGCKDCHKLVAKGKFCRNHQMMFNRIGRVESLKEFGVQKVW